MKTMDRHDESTLWAYAARELDDGEVRLVEDHLDDCPDCRERLASVQIAREALEGARETLPKIAWQPIDDTIGRLVEKRLAAQARRPMFLRLGLGFATLAVAAVLAFVALTRVDSPTVPVAVKDTPPPPPSPVVARVDRSFGLERSGLRDVPDGTLLSPGDVLKTTQTGKAFVHLPDLSHLRLAGSSSLTLSRISVDDVALTLEHGRVAVRASHQDRKGFVIYSGGLAVHVVGTVFSVSETSDGTEVAVSEGRVRVDLPNDEEEFVDAGQRLRVDAKGRVARGLKVTSALARELDEVMTVGDAATAVETNAVVAAAGGRTSEPPLLSAQGTPRTLPRLSAKDSRSRQVELPAEAVATGPGMNESELTPLPSSPAPAPARVEPPTTQRLYPTTELVVETPAPAPAAPQNEPVQQQPASDPNEWAALPPQPVVVAPVTLAAASPGPNANAKLHEEPVTTATQKPLARDLESIFMNHAELSLEQGTCDRFLIGLEDIAQDASHTPRTEYARVLRARCFNLQLRPRQAVNEYRKYLEEYPRGRFTQEAAEAVGP